MVSQKAGKRLFLSFPRKRESSLSKVFWTPAFAGVTAWRTFYETIKFPVRSNWPHGREAARLSSVVCALISDLWLLVCKFIPLLEKVFPSKVETKFTLRFSSLTSFKVEVKPLSNSLEYL
jgi:hypothetical protein